MIWFEPKSPHSRYGRLHLDLFPTPYTLTEEGQREMADLLRRLSVPGRVVVSPDDAHWEQVPRGRMEELARAVQRSASRLGNTEMRQRQSSPELAGKVLPWRKVG